MSLILGAMAGGAQALQNDMMTRIKAEIDEQRAMRVAEFSAQLRGQERQAERAEKKQDLEAERTRVSGLINSVPGSTPGTMDQEVVETDDNYGQGVQRLPERQRPMADVLNERGDRLIAAGDVKLGTDLVSEATKIRANESLAKSREGQLNLKEAQLGIKSEILDWKQKMGEQNYGLRAAALEAKREANDLRAKRDSDRFSDLEKSLKTIFTSKDAMGQERVDTAGYGLAMKITEAANAQGRSHGDALMLVSQTMDRINSNALAAAGKDADDASLEKARRAEIQKAYAAMSGSARPQQKAAEPMSVRPQAKAKTREEPSIPEDSRMDLRPLPASPGEAQTLAIKALSGGAPEMDQKSLRKALNANLTEQQRKVILEAIKRLQAINLGLL